MSEALKPEASTLGKKSAIFFEDGALGLEITGYIDPVPFDGASPAHQTLEALQDQLPRLLEYSKGRIASAILAADGKTVDPYALADHAAFMNARRFNRLREWGEITEKMIQRVDAALKADEVMLVPDPAKGQGAYTTKPAEPGATPPEQV